MVQRCCGFGLASKALESESVGLERLGKELQCDLALELGIFRKKDFPHASLANRLDDAIPAHDTCSRRNRRILSARPARREFSTMR